MTKKHLTIFAAVYKEGSITMAAEKLYMTQPAVSLAIHQLEDYYGVKLFDRLNRRLSVTQAGHELYQYAAHILELFQDVETSMKNWEQIGRLRIGSSITIGTQLMPKLVKEFQVKYPDLDIRVNIQSSDRIEELLLNNDLDLALIEGIIHSEHLIAKDFYEDSLALVCCVDHPLLKKDRVTTEDLKGEKLLLREPASGTREIAQHILALHNLAVNPAWESTSTQAILNAVSEGIGISVLPLHLIDSYKNSHRIRRLPIENMNFKRTFKLVYHKNKFLSKTMEDFFQMCLQLGPFS